MIQHSQSPRSRPAPCAKRGMPLGVRTAAGIALALTCFGAGCGDTSTSGASTSSAPTDTGSTYGGVSQKDFEAEASAYERTNAYGNIVLLDKYKSSSGPFGSPAWVAKYRDPYNEEVCLYVFRAPTGQVTALPATGCPY